ncbi:COPI associated [Aaosphaeria arxii CBS 175.79]|uniref:COPI associated n=1 Tax=Aaosphaeria arxii CBS 175.79 TaxID=1450172 RepID=A0A6A5XAZ7_9PLEO|nr:COPI associated [Aaosphaeria arxii CBS 175.79]KAF2010016.1 COPI associated [Aaosphaeria arxii CBS 175.79]
MDFSDIFRIVNFAVAVFMVLGGISKFFGFNDLIGALGDGWEGWINMADELGFSDIILGVYLVLFGAGTALLGSAIVEFRWTESCCRRRLTFPAQCLSGKIQIPPQVARYASFMFSFLGRGVFYIFIGSVIVGPGWFRWLPGTIVGVIGIGYAVLEYIPSIEPPANMRDADAGWGAEQV